MLHDAFNGKRVWISGHTGFKGAWLAEWLLALGARVTGFALPPPTTPALFDQLGLAHRLTHQEGDVRNAEAVRESILEAQPDVVFHLAAQPLVRYSYQHPLETYATNVMGTVHVLEALRQLDPPCAAVFVTSDKCYENQGWLHGYREGDPLGGQDPYSSSKAAAELVISAYRRSFFLNHPVRVASARAGNVIGGGDWAADRIVPDCLRALQANRPITIRNPHSTRPWQHVLEPLSGYLALAARLSADAVADQELTACCSAFNFGPGLDANRTVQDLVTEVLKHWPGRWEHVGEPNAVSEARLLQLHADKAFCLLRWAAVWSFSEAVAETMHWYRQAATLTRPEDVIALTRGQIEAYCARAREREVKWAAA